MDNMHLELCIFYIKFRKEKKMKQQITMSCRQRFVVAWFVSNLMLFLDHVIKPL